MTYININLTCDLKLTQVIKLPILNEKSKEYIEFKENIFNKIKLPDLAAKKE